MRPSLSNRFIIGLIALAAVLSCKSAYLKDAGGGKKVDLRLVGVWQGSEKDQQMEGVSKKWEMIRNDDATFKIDFETFLEGDTSKLTETGNWWVKGDKFYEYHKGSGQTDVYTYKILHSDQVKFSSFKMAYAMDAGKYEFTDTRKKKQENAAVDNAVFKNAIKVNSVPEEYAYVKEACKNCVFKGQALRMVEGKPYDVLTMETAEGEKQVYYFDISAFYGKK